jgi:hypothetical protein
MKLAPIPLSPAKMLFMAGAVLACCSMAGDESPTADQAEPTAPLDGVAAELLYRDPAGLNWANVLNARIKAGEPIPAWPARKAAPGDDQAPAELLAYWRNCDDEPPLLRPTPLARQKLLTAVSSDPTALGAVLRFLPATDAAARKIAGLLDKLPAEPRANREVHQQARAWIYQHCGLLRERVIEDARHADWERYVYHERPDWALAALQQREPAAATKLLVEMTAGANAGVATVATSVLLASADAGAAPHWREWLIAAAANPKYPEKARQIAVQALLKAKWQGREEWVLTSLGRDDDGDPEWFIHEMWDSRDRWIPKLARMVRGANRQARERAAYLLARYEASAETLQPLLPWLDDPQWGGERNAYRRLKLFQGLNDVRLPAAVPALKQALEEDADDSIIGAAAEALACHKVKDAVPALKAALNRAESRGSTDRIVASVHKLGGFTRDEIAGGLEYFSVTCPTWKERDEIDFKPMVQRPRARLCDKIPGG